VDSNAPKSTFEELLEFTMGSKPYQPSLELAIYHLQCEGYTEEAQLVKELMEKSENMIDADEAMYNAEEESYLRGF
jgi:hypothetical protein